MFKNMGFKTWLLNGWYYARFYWKAYFTNYFKNPVVNENPEKPGYTLEFSDEFNEPIDWEKWHWCEGFSCKRDQVIFKQEQVSQNNGDAVLTSDLNNVPDEPLVKSGGLYSWKSYSAKYGFFESRWLLTPGGIKYWPAYWLSSMDSWPPEIDVFELMGDNSSYFTMTLHWRNVWTNEKEIQKIYDEIQAVYGYVPKDYDNTIRFLQQPEWSEQKQAFIDRLGALTSHEMKGRRLKFPGKDFLAQGYHTWGCEWTDKKVVWYLDNLSVYVLDKHVPERNMLILLTHNYTYDKNVGPDPSDVPESVYVDYIRAYKKD